MARGKAITIGPRGTCCRQYEARQGLWFEKNVAPRQHRWPDAFPEPFIRERCLDALGRPASSKQDALECCHRRRNEIQRQIDGLNAGLRDLSPDDVGTFASILANRRAMALRTEGPLQTLPVQTLTPLLEAFPLWQGHLRKAPLDRMIEAVERGGDFVDALNETDAVWSSGGIDELDRDTMNAIAVAFKEALSASGPWRAGKAQLQIIDNSPPLRRSSPGGTGILCVGILSQPPPGIGQRHRPPPPSKRPTPSPWPASAVLALELATLATPRWPSPSSAVLPAAKKDLGLSFSDLGALLGADEVWVAALIYGQATASAEQAATLLHILKLDSALAPQLTSCPVKGALDPVIPTDPLLYRF